MSDNQFIDGLIVKAPNERAPEYVKARLSIKRAELIAWLQGQTGDWINADIKVSQNGKWYCAVDNWKPESKPESSAPRQRQGAPSRDASYADMDSDDVPFAPIPHRSYL
jgi:hypothetical protein